MAPGEPNKGAWRGYLYSLLLLGAIVGAGYYLRASVTLSNHIMLYLLVVVYSAVQWGRGPSIVTAVASTVLADWFFVPPVFELFHGEPKYMFTLISLLCVGLVISTLTSRLREQTRTARQREADMTSLYTLSQDLAQTKDPPQVLEVSADHISRGTGGQAAIFLPGPDGLRVAFVTPGWMDAASFAGRAQEAFDRGRPVDGGAGAPDGERWARLIPLRTAAGIMGVLGLQWSQRAGGLTPAQERLVETLASQAALAIERSQLEEREREARLLQEKYKLQKALLDSISHDLRTPLASITGAISSLHEDHRMLDEATRQDLVATARHEADRLNRLVANLLDMTRLESGALHVMLQPCDLQDVVGAALARVEQIGNERPVQVTLAPGLPLVSLDFLLVTQVLANLLDNAMKYSPPGSPIEITAEREEDRLQVRVFDQGCGIPREHVERVFEKFYRVHRPDSPKGSGLGLSICRGFIEAHGGSIWAEPRDGGGTVLAFSLPLEPAPVSRTPAPHG
jgi:two-component system sensor histidine kinase KdpD